MKTTNDPAAGWKQHSRQELERIPGNRAYALDGASELSLAAFCKSYRDVKGERYLAGDLGPLLERLAKVLPEMVQQRPDAEPEAFELPWPIIDPITGQQVENPFTTRDVASQNALVRRAPKLAEHLRRRAGGYTFAMHAEKLDADANRAAFENIRYDAKSHENNPFRFGVEGVSAQNEFVKNNSPETVEFFRREAQPLQFPWQKGDAWNLTQLNAMLRIDRELYDCAMAAQAIEADWNSMLLKQAQADAAQAAQEAEDARKRIGSLSRVEHR